MWPFKYINGEQTPESVALEGGTPGEAKPQEKPLKPYNVALLETNEEEALL